ncbi:MAG: metallophosphoesterase, partial [Candidatus Omnitrophota bacterium]|nr:metallophosphoesterase [Candidatus Omnitrophota bacterium]
MLRYRYRHIVLLGFLALIGLFITLPCFAEDKVVSIVFSGDMRGEIENCHCPQEDFGGLPRRAEYIAEVRDEAGEILLLDVGDIIQLVTDDSDTKDTAHKASISFKAMDMTAYTAMNVGESDLILGEDFLRQNELKASFPFLSANIVNKDTGEAFFKPYVVKTMQNGLRVGILGLVNERYVINSDQLKILPHKDAALQYIPELKTKSDIVIVLGHIGLPYAEDLAQAVKGIDVILSGHWDVENPQPLEIEDTLVMPVTFRSRKIGRLDLMIKDGVRHSYDWASTSLGAEYDGNIAIEKLVSSNKEEVAKIETEKSHPQKEALSSGVPLRVFVFYAPGCKACVEVDRYLLTHIKDKYQSDILVEHFNVSDAENYEQMLRLENLYGVKGGYAPEVITAGYVLKGKEEITSSLDGIIQKAVEEGYALKTTKDQELQVFGYQPPEDSLIVSRFKTFSIYAVLGAGLLDGVNPCAFTTIVFFISFLAFVGYRKRDILLTGISFTIAVFIAYILIGLGIFNFLKSLKVFNSVTYYINIVIGSLAFFLGFLSLLDYIRFKKTKDVKNIILKLPQAIKNRVHSIIGSDFRETGEGRSNIFRLLWVAFTAGFIVSILESFCTGQIYLPTIAFVIKMPDKNLSALCYLVLYNIAFIAPLVVVLFLGFFGVTSSS